jgi:Cys-rich repeat protein
MTRLSLSLACVVVTVLAGCTGAPPNLQNDSSGNHPLNATACTADSQCSDGTRCVEGACAGPDTDAITCSTDADCPTREPCTNGVCVAPVDNTPPGCTSDADCASGEACDLNGNCDVVDPPLPSCTTNADCAQGTVCQAGVCIRDGGQAPASCTLLQNSCGDGATCYPGGPTVDDGYCTPAGTQQLGQACIDPSEADVQTCAAGLVCASANADGSNTTCFQLCLDDSVCASGSTCTHFQIDDAGHTGPFGACVAATPQP